VSETRPVAKSETRPVAKEAEAEESPQRAWTIHTVESWGRAIIDDMVQELVVRNPEATGVEAAATYACFRDDDGGFYARIQVHGIGTYNVHRVKSNGERDILLRVKIG
jgi:hypothetical protein